MAFSLENMDQNTLLMVCAVVIFLVYHLTRSEGYPEDDSVPTQKVTVYGTMQCGWTVKWLDMLKAAGVDYNFVDCTKETCPPVSGYPHTKVENNPKVTEIVGADQSKIELLK